MKKAVLIAVLVLLALRGAIWVFEEYDQKLAESSAISTGDSKQATNGSENAFVAQAKPADPEPDAPVASSTPSGEIVEVPSPVASVPASGPLIEPIFDLPFEPIIQFLASKPAASIEDVTLMLNRKFKGRIGVPMAFYLDQGGPDEVKKALNLPSSGQMRLPPPLTNECKRNEYWIGVRSVKASSIQLALLSGHVEVEMPNGFAAGKITGMKDGVAVSTIHAMVARPPFAVSDDAKQFFYFVFLPKDELTSDWWRQAQKAIKKPAFSSPYLVYSVSDNGIEFSAAPALYETASYIPTPSAGKDGNSKSFGYNKGVTIDTWNVCAPDIKKK